MAQRAEVGQEDGPRRRGIAPAACVGLALSGGGIRSATVCLGFMQGLARFRAASERSVLDYVDYLSTVSGGGWAGGAFTVRMLASATREDGHSLRPGAEPPFRPEQNGDWESLAKTLRGRGDYLVPGGLGITAGTIRPLLILLTGAIVQIVALACFGVAGLLRIYNTECTGGFLSQGLHWASHWSWIEQHQLYFKNDVVLASAKDRCSPPSFDPLYGLNIGVVAGFSATLFGAAMMVVGTLWPSYRMRESGSWLAARAFVPSALVAIACLAVRGNVDAVYVFLAAAAIAALFIYAKKLSRTEFFAVAAAIVTGQSLLVHASTTLQNWAALLAGDLHEFLHRILIWPATLAQASGHHSIVLAAFALSLFHGSRLCLESESSWAPRLLDRTDSRSLFGPAGRAAEEADAARRLDAAREASPVGTRVFAAEPPLWTTEPRFYATERKAHCAGPRFRCGGRSFGPTRPSVHCGGRRSFRPALASVGPMRATTNRPSRRNPLKSRISVR